MLDLILDFNYFSFSNCNINPNPTHLAKHQILSPNHQFSQCIWYVECFSVHAHIAWGQVIQPPTLLWNVLSLLNSVLQKVRVCTMDFVPAAKNTLLLLYVTVCEKVVPRLNRQDDVIEWNLMKIAPTEMKSWLRPLLWLALLWLALLLLAPFSFSELFCNMWLKFQTVGQHARQPFKLVDHIH